MRHLLVGVADHIGGGGYGHCAAQGARVAGTGHHGAVGGGGHGGVEGGGAWGPAGRCSRAAQPVLAAT